MPTANTSTLPSESLIVSRAFLMAFELNPPHSELLLLNNTTAVASERGQLSPSKPSVTLRFTPSLPQSPASPSGTCILRAPPSDVSEGGHGLYRGEFPLLSKECSIESSSCSYGRRDSMVRCALRSFAEATSFIAEVIFSVPRTEPILSFISLRDDIRPLLRTQLP